MLPLKIKKVTIHSKSAAYTAEAHTTKKIHRKQSKKGELSGHLMTFLLQANVRRNVDNSDSDETNSANS